MPNYFKGSGEGSSPADPPFAQLAGGDTNWKDKLGIFAQGAFNSIAPDFMRRAVGGAGDAAAYLKRKKAARNAQQLGIGSAEREFIRNKATERLKEFGGGE